MCGFSGLRIPTLSWPPTAPASKCSSCGRQPASCCLATQASGAQLCTPPPPPSCDQLLTTLPAPPDTVLALDVFRKGWLFASCAKVRFLRCLGGWSQGHTGP